MRDRIKRLLKSTLGRIALVLGTFPIWKLIYNAIDAWGNLRMVAEYVPEAWRFLDSTSGTFAVMLTGFALIGLLLWTQKPKDTSHTEEDFPPKQQVADLCPDRSVHEIAEQQRRGIARQVLAVNPRMNFKGLREHAPYFTVTFDVVNTSVFLVSIEEIKGALFLNGNLLSGSAKLMATGLQYLPVGDRRELVIQQWVNPQEASLILDATDASTQLGFAGLDVRIKGGSNSLNIEPQRLVLPTAIPVCTLDTLEAQIGKTEKKLEEETVKYNQAAGTSDSLLKQCDSIQAQLNDLKADYGWLHEEVEKQRRNISEYVEVEKITRSDLVLKKGVSLVKFGVYITNKSVLDIAIAEKLDDLAGGRIKFEDTPLLGTKRVIYPVENLSHGRTACLTIEQRLEEGEAREIEQARDGWRANFYFDELQLHIVGGERSHSIDRQRLIIKPTTSVEAFPRPVEQRVRQLQTLSTVYGIARNIYEHLRLDDTPLTKEQFEKWETDAEEMLAAVYGNGKARRICLDLFHHTSTFPDASGFQQDWFHKFFREAEYLMAQEREAIKH
jgi:hypothetical protein